MLATHPRPAFEPLCVAACAETPSLNPFLFFKGFTRTKPRRNPAFPPFRAPSPADRAPPEARAFFALLFGAAGLDAGHYRDRALVRRLPACFRALGVRSLAEASARIASRPELARTALSSVLLGVTEFFRDPAVFHVLETTLLPELLARQKRPRIWSAACSDGQELYSVAMLLARQGQLSACELLGTDCRRDALARAAQGAFMVEANRRLSASGALAMEQGRHHMSADLRGAITWKQADVLTAAEPGPWDLILCRNLAIYLEPAAATRLWATLIKELAPGGYLVVGKADYPARHLLLTRVASGIYRKDTP